MYCFFSTIIYNIFEQVYGFQDFIQEMVKTANLYARIEPDVKEQADRYLRDIFEYIAFNTGECSRAVGSAGGCNQQA